MPRNSAKPARRNAAQPVLVTGTIGIDTVITPADRANQVLGGSATFFAAASANFTPTSLVSVAGGDLPLQAKRFYHHTRNVDCSDLTIVASGKTFTWTGKYLDDFKERVTLKTELNTVTGYEPKVSGRNRDIPFVFLANTDPNWQMQVLNQMRRPRFVGVDTMNLWIASFLPSLKKLLKKADILLVNDSEAAELTGESALLKSARAILKMGPKAVIIKKGPYGASLYTTRNAFHVPAFEIDRVVDPTGAGDSFAGGLMGYLGATGRCDLAAIRTGMLVGAVCAARAVSDFSVFGLLKATRAQLLREARALHNTTLCEEIAL